MKKQTGKYWLKTLPPSLRKAVRDNISDEYELNRKFYSLELFILTAFTWVNSNEGEEFWQSFYLALTNDNGWLVYKK